MVAGRWRWLEAAGGLLPVGAVVAMTVVDVVVSRAVAAPLLPILTTDLAVGAAVLVVRPLPALAAVAAPVVSLGASVVTWALLEDGRYPSLETSNWYGFGELVALACVAALAVRVLQPAVAFLTTGLFGVALLAIIDLRHAGTAARVIAAPLLVGFAAAVAVGLYLRSVDRARVLADAEVRQAERTEIARELHDLVAHHVTGIVLQAQAARLVSDTQPEVAVDVLATIEDAGSQALRSMRAMVGSLRADEAAPLAPAATLDDLRAMASARPGEVEVRVSLDDRLDRVPASIVSSLHRIAREALTNARRHARGATRIDVSVACSGGEATVAVTDDGDPVTGQPGQGFGLVGIAERVDALGGRFRAGPRPEGGWEVAATLPVASP